MEICHADVGLGSARLRHFPSSYQVFSTAGHSVFIIGSFFVVSLFSNDMNRSDTNKNGLSFTSQYNYQIKK